MKYRINDKETIVRLCIAFVVASGLVLTVASIYGAASPNPEAATDEERALFDALRGRVVANSDKWPVNVNDVLQSFDPNDPLIITFTCQGSTADINTVNIRIITRLAHWNETADPNITGMAGYYYWDWTGTISNGAKNATIDNELLLNPAELNESDQSKRPENEAVLYHELLHGELIIRAMKAIDNNDWRNEFCNCSFNYSVGGIGDNDAANATHDQIYAYEEDYYDNITSATTTPSPTPTTTRSSTGASSGKYYIYSSLDKFGIIALIIGLIMVSILKIRKKL